MHNSEYIELPCKIEKCIAYPSCVSKEKITCMYLRDTYDSIIKANQQLANRTAKAFAIIHQTLPNLQSITSRIKAMEKAKRGSM